MSGGCAPRLLVVTAREPWPLNGGGRIRLFNFVRGLAGRFEVTLAIPGPVRHAQHMPAGVRVVSTASGAYLPLSRPDSWFTRRVQAFYGHDSRMWRWLVAHATPRNFDVALVHGVANGPYADAIDVPVVWDPVDELVLTAARNAEVDGLAGWPRAACLSGFYAVLEHHVSGRVATTVFSSPTDASYARRWCGSARIVAISNGVDFSYFSGPVCEAVPGTVAFVGALSFPPNVEAMTRFVRDIWPGVHARDPRRRMLIVGRSPCTVVQSLDAVAGVSVLADVPDVRPTLSQASVVVVPTRLGAGVKNKVLEACAMGRPVVASPRALDGLCVRRGRDVVCVHGRDAWVERLDALLRDPERAAAIGRRGQEWVRQHHHWPGLARGLADVLADAQARRSPKTRCGSEVSLDLPVAIPDSTRAVTSDSYAQALSAGQTSRPQPVCSARMAR